MEIFKLFIKKKLELVLERIYNLNVNSFANGTWRNNEIQLENHSILRFRLNWTSQIFLKVRLGSFYLRKQIYF